MQKQTIFILVLSMFALAVVVYLGFFGFNLPFFATVPFTSGCVQINNPTTPNASYTQVTSASSYTCDADECVVWGNMNVNNPTLSKVIIRTSGSYGSGMCVGADFNQDSLLEGKKLSTSIGSNTGFNPTYTRSDGLGFKFTSDNKVEVGYVGSTSWRKTSTTSCTIDSSIIPNTNCQAPELCAIQNMYSATFNFCPDPNFPYCSGDKNSIVSSIPNTYITDEFKINRGESVTFNPKYTDNTEVTEKYIYIRKGDCTCLNAISSGQACASDKLYCKPKANICPSGYSLLNPNSQTVYCQNAFRGEGTYSRFYSGNPICHEGLSQYSYAKCAEPTTDYTKYLRCDGAKVIDAYGHTCNDWKTEVSCPSGQNCYVDATGQIGEGIGGCKCPTDPCKLGDKEQNPLDPTQYRECKQIGNCLNWNVYKYCPSGLVYDALTKTCLCDQTKTCNPGTSQCTSINQLRKCTLATFSGVDCYILGLAESCLGDTQCNSQTNLCDCSLVDKCKVGDIQCTDESHYKICSKGTETYSCFDFRDIITADESQTCTNNAQGFGILTTKSGCSYNNPACPSDKDCVNNVCVCKTTGDYCDFNSPQSCVSDYIYKKCEQTGDCYQFSQYTCPSGTKCKNGQCYNVGCMFPGTGYDCNTANFEECVNNKCTCKQDDNTATESDYLTKITKCSGNTVQIAIKYGNCYRWENKKDAPDSIEGVCKLEYACMVSGNTATCQPGFKYLGIIPKESYAINDNIDEVKIQVTPEVPNYKNIRIVARLLENGNEIIGTRKDTFADSSGIVTIDFNYKPTRTGDITIEAIAGNPETSNFKATKTIHILNKLLIKLNCPATSYVNRDIICSWKSQDRDTGAIVTSTPSITLMQGTKDLDYQPLTNAITFTTDKVGSINIKVEISKEGYISDSESTAISVQQTERVQTFYIDNSDVFTLIEGVNSGTHQLKFKVEESEVIADVQTIDGRIRNPSGQETGVVFNKQGDYWIGSYNFAQAGQVYKFSGSIIFTDISKENLNFEYSISTVKSQTEDIKGQFIIIIISAIASVLLIIVIIVVLLIKRRKNV